MYYMYICVYACMHICITCLTLIIYIYIYILYKTTDASKEAGNRMSLGWFGGARQGSISERLREALRCAALRFRALLGWHYLSRASCLIRPHVFHVCFIMSKFITLGYIVCSPRLNKHVLDK